MRADAAAAAFVEACRAELQALKPGNVHIFAAGHAMTVEDFLASANAAAPALCHPGQSVGERILAGEAATRRAVGCNTNLGILLLAAPLVHAAIEGPAAAAGDGLRRQLARVLDRLTVADAEAAFAAIRLAAPAGLGRAARHDVHEPASVTLRVAMAEAAAHDRIARQYAEDYADVFELGVATAFGLRAIGADPEAITEAIYLKFLSAFPDSHISRKFGTAVAEQVCREAAAVASAFQPLAPAAERRPALAKFDRALKARGLNPGTSADLTVAGLLAARLAHTLGRPIVSSAERGVTIKQSEF
ncbi:MAG: triphosphoribosyl-dephospho-CoA synthase [Azospirillum sp.]|nr:triphosphoribosyl-dephospho-CoA synthase [Azospirillum sp.]